MNRREKLERIIIGTLLESREGRNFYDDCRSLVTADMFGNDVCRKIYGFVQDMNRNGKEDTTPLAILDEYGADAMALSGSDFRQILSYYYTGTELVSWAEN